MRTFIGPTADSVEIMTKKVPVVCVCGEPGTREPRDQLKIKKFRVAGAFLSCKLERHQGSRQTKLFCGELGG